MALAGSKELTQASFGVRLRILGIVVFNLALALGVVTAIVWLSGRPGLKKRIDLTHAKSNTIDGQLADTLDRLEGELRIDSFFRAEDPPLGEIIGDVQARLFALLMQTEEYAPELVEFTDHPYMPPGAGGTELVATMREFGVRGSFNTVVLSYSAPGDEGPVRRTVLNLLGEVAEVDLGNPFKHAGNYRPPELVSYRGQEALLRGILKVTQGEKPLALFSKGHGESSLFEDDDRAMGRLHSALVADGFRVETWSPEEDGALPEDTAVLAICGPDERFSEQALEWIGEYVRGGGSIIAAPGLELAGGQGSIAELLTHFGILLRPGIVCRPFLGADGMATVGTPKVAQVIVRSEHMAARHPIVEPLRRGDRRISLVFTHPFDRGRPPVGGVLLDLLRSSELSWEEFPNKEGKYEWIWDQEREPGGPFSLAMTSVFPPSEMGPAPAPGTNPERPECRVLAIGTPEVFNSVLFDTNRDFLLNAFNWAASREFRVSISPRKHDVRVIDLGEDRTMFYIGLASVWLLPGACALIGLLMFLRRRN